MKAAHQFYNKPPTLAKMEQYLDINCKIKPVNNRIKKVVCLQDPQLVLLAMDKFGQVASSRYLF